MYESGSESCEYKIVTFLQATLVLPKCQRNGGGTGVSEVLDVHHHVIHRQVKTLGHGLDDAHVGLMGYHESDIVLVQTVALGYEHAVVTHVRHGIAEHRAAFLIKVVQTVVYCEI